MTCGKPPFFWIDLVATKPPVVSARAKCEPQLPHGSPRYALENLGFFGDCQVFVYYPYVFRLAPVNRLKYEIPRNYEW